MGQAGNRAVVVAALLSAVAVLLALPAAGMAKRTYSSPGYHWNGKLPKVAPVIPGKLIKLGDGAYPHVLVDAAGTGQIAYTTEPEDGPSVLHDCVLMRGQTGCAANPGLVPDEPGADPRYNTDNQGPTPLAIGNQLLMLTSRYPIPETLPDGTTGYPTFLYTSEDGGKSFTGPGEVGQLAVSGNAVVFGGDNPQIGIISDTETGGTFFQASPPGAFTSQRLVLGDQGPDEAYNGRLAVDGTRRSPSSPIWTTTSTSASTTAPATSSTPTAGHGRGSTARATRAWSVVPAASGCSTRRPTPGRCSSSRSCTACPPGAASQVTPNTRLPARQLRDHRGRRRATHGRMVQRRSSSTSLYTQSSTDGRHWSAPQLIAKGLDDPSYMTLGSAGDGGGFAAFQTPEPGGVVAQSDRRRQLRLGRRDRSEGPGQPRRRWDRRARRRSERIGVVHRRALRRHRRDRRGRLFPARPQEPEPAARRSSPARSASTAWRSSPAPASRS